MRILIYGKSKEEAGYHVLYTNESNKKVVDKLLANCMLSKCEEGLQQSKCFKLAQDCYAIMHTIGFEGQQQMDAETRCYYNSTAYMFTAEEMDMLMKEPHDNVMALPYFEGRGQNIHNFLNRAQCAVEAIFAAKLEKEDNGEWKQQETLFTYLFDGLLRGDRVIYHTKTECNVRAVLDSIHFFPLALRKEISWSSQVAKGSEAGFFELICMEASDYEKSKARDFEGMAHSLRYLEYDGTGANHIGTPEEEALRTYYMDLMEKAPGKLDALAAKSHGEKPVFFQLLLQESLEKNQMTANSTTNVEKEAKHAQSQKLEWNDSTMKAFMLGMVTGMSFTCIILGVFAWLL